MPGHCYAAGRHARNVTLRAERSGRCLILNMCQRLLLAEHTAWRSISTRADYMAFYMLGWQRII